MAVKYAPEVVEAFLDYNPNAAWLVAMNRSGKPIYGGFKSMHRDARLAALDEAAHERRVEARRVANKRARAQRRVNAQ